MEEDQSSAVFSQTMQSLLPPQMIEPRVSIHFNRFHFPPPGLQLRFSWVGQLLKPAKDPSRQRLMVLPRKVLGMLWRESVLS